MSAVTNALKLKWIRTPQRSAAHMGVRSAQLNLELAEISKDMALDEG